MDWKEFLKPTLMKIIVFLSIPTSFFILILFFGRIGFLLKSVTTVYSILALPVFVFWMILDGTGIEAFPDIATGSPAEIFGEVSLFLFAIFWLYYLSCAVISIYDNRYKPVKKNI